MFSLFVSFSLSQATTRSIIFYDLIAITRLHFPHLPEINYRVYSEHAVRETARCSSGTGWNSTNANFRGIVYVWVSSWGEGSAGGVKVRTIVSLPPTTC